MDSNKKELDQTQDRIRQDFQTLRELLNQRITDAEANMLNLVKKEHEDLSIKLLKLQQDIPALQLYIHQNQNKDFKLDLRE